MSKSNNTSKNKLKDLRQFLQTGIWRIRANTYVGHRRFWLKQLRVILLALRGFAEDKCQLRASALTYYSLLSIVPLVAMAFGIAKGFGVEKLLEKEIYKHFTGQEEVLEKIILFSQTMLDNTKGGIIAGIGVLILFWAVIRVLGNIEKSFNEIWGVKKGRGFARKLSDYLSIMMVCPFLLIISSSITVMISTQVTALIGKLSFLGPFAPLILVSLKILPFLVIWILFTYIYMFMPNVKVSFHSAWVGGVIAGTVYQLFQWIYIGFQLGASRYGAIYGSFAALPLFLIWLQMSWIVVLLGAEIVFADQNVDTYEFEPDCAHVSNRFKQLAALLICKTVVDRFLKHEKPLTANQISHQLEMPIRLTNEVLFDLTKAKILSEVRTDTEHDYAYQPGMDVNKMSVASVIIAINTFGIDEVPILETDELTRLRPVLDTLYLEIIESPENILIKKL